MLPTRDRKPAARAPAPSLRQCELDQVHRVPALPRGLAVSQLLVGTPLVEPRHCRSTGSVSMADRRPRRLPTRPRLALPMADLVRAPKQLQARAMKRPTPCETLLNGCLVPSLADARRTQFSHRGRPIKIVRSGSACMTQGRKRSRSLCQANRLLFDDRVAHPEPVEQIRILPGCGIARRQKHIAREDRVGACEKAQGL